MSTTPLTDERKPSPRGRILIRIRSHHGRRLAAVIVAAIVLAAAAAGAASFAALSWNNAAGGSASTATNWTPNQVPTSADDLTFNVVAVYPVTFNASTATSRTHTYRRGTVTLTATSPHSVTNGVTVGDLAGDVGSATLSSGLVTSNAAVIVGDASGATGTLNVSGNTADLVLATSAGDLTVGDGGVGTLNVTNLGFVQVADRFIAGGNSTSSATVTVSGGNSVPLLRSTLDVDGTGLPSAVGAGGDATMSVSSGGLASFSGTLNVAQGSASSSSLTIGGFDVFKATLSTGANLNVGGNTSPSVAAGFGTVTVNDEGVLDVGGALNVGNDPDGGSGLLVLEQGGAITTGSLAVGTDGELDIDGGTLDIDGGAFTYANPTVGLVLGGPQEPLVTLENGATGTLSTVVAGRALTIGGGAGASACNFDVRSGSALNVAAGDIVIGETPVGIGEMIVNGSGSSLTMSPASKLVVARLGDAMLQIEESATASLGTLCVGEFSGSNGLVAFELFSTVDVGDVYVGGSPTSAGGIGDFRVSAQAVCNVANPGGVVKVWPTGELQILGGTLNADSVRIGGEFLMTSASFDPVVNADDFVVSNGSAVCAGAINGRVNLTSASAEIRATGDLTLGDASDVDGFRNSGRLDCDGAIVTLLDAGVAVLNTATIDGGTLIAENGCVISAFDSLTGSGTIDSDVQNAGTILCTGSGLTFKGIVTGDGTNFEGTIANFADGGGFVGFGAIGASITADSTTSFELTETLTLGTLFPLDEISIDGAIDVGAHTLVLRDANAAELGGTTTIAGGVIMGILPGADLLLEGDGVIVGSGLVQADFTGESGTRITASGPLEIGASTESEGFRTAGRLEVGSHAVTIKTDVQARLGRSTTIAGGTLGHNGSGYFVLESGDTLSGFGTVSGGIEQGPGSVIRAAGALTIGASPSGLPILADGGLLDVNSSAVTLLGASGATLPLTTTIAGGTLGAASTILVQGGGVLRGHGTITAPVVNTGTIEVGDSIGTLTIANDFDNVTGGIIEIEVGRAGNFDRLVVTGRLDLTELGGGTLRIAQLPGLVVSAADTFSIISGAPLVGQFENVVFADRYLDNLFDVSYTPTQVLLVATAATGVDLPPAGDTSGDFAGSGAIPSAFALRITGGNPTTLARGTSFEYDIPGGGAAVSLAIFDASGRLVSRIVDGMRPAGRHPVEWRAAESGALASGVYFLRMDAGAFGATEKLVLMR